MENNILIGRSVLVVLIVSAFVTGLKNINDWLYFFVVVFLQYSLGRVVYNFFIGEEMSFSGAYLDSGAEMEYRVLMFVCALFLFYFLSYMSFIK